MFVVVLFATSMLAGCMGENKAVAGGEDAFNVYTEPWERADLEYNDQDIYARVTVNGTYALDEVRSVYVPVDTITAADGGAGLTGDAEVHLGLFMPCLLYTSPSPRDRTRSRMPSSA